MPQVANIPECKSVNYLVSLEWAWIYCSLPNYAVLNANLIVQKNPLTQSDLSIYQPVATITVPTIGQGSMAAELANGKKDILLVFYKGNTLIRIENATYNPDGISHVNIENVVTLAQQLDKLIPNQIVPPLALSFPDQLNKAAFNTYFSGIDINIRNYQTFEKQAFFCEKCLVYFKAYPKVVSNDLYMVGVYDLQKKIIIFKYYFEMNGNDQNFGMPTDLKAGDKFEVRIAVGDTLVYVFPFEAK